MTVVYDLDGTVVRLTVDWDIVRRDVAAMLDGQDVTVDPEADLWGLFRRAREAGLLADAERIISAHERAGARESERLACADLLARDAPTAVCSLNSTGACHIALGSHRLREHVPVVVGRDAGPWEKPEPEPLLAAIDGLGADPAETTFVGDGERDERTAERAGVEFVYVSEWVRRA
ncbi:HAD family hydrolase [Halosegnis sp.]|uniref:HAD family hydrolase n=1 Tax=Halosegnis sp. TaxID=2864959 RepID=UPI0035D51E64